MSPSQRELIEAARLVRTGHAAGALPHLASWVRNAGAFGPVHSLHLEALIALGRTREASLALDAALDHGDADADASDALAFMARRLGRHEISNELYRRATELRPADPQFWYNYSTSERSLGRLASASQACARALELDPNMRPAILLRSELARATPDRNNVADLEARLTQPMRESDAMLVAYALGKELHELGLYDRAFSAFCRGASARRRSLDYDVGVDERKLKAIASAFGDRGGAAPASGGRHIFIVGLPRSGTTLTERILGGLTGVRSNDETDNFSAALMRHAPADSGSVFERAARADFAAVAAEYDELARALDHGDHIIEKLPFNYLYIGAILRSFADASVVWVRRNPLDSCFAMFRTLFASAYPFSYDFDDLARYYAAYEALMGHWSELYGDRLIHVHYESLVTDPAAIAPILATRCGLAWQDAALDISNNASASLTASASQVRAGIYTSSAGAWRNYGGRLEPLKRKLAARGVAVSDLDSAA